MRKTITVAAYNRPHLLGLLLKSLEEQMRPLDDYRLYIRIDGGGDRFEDVKQVALGVDFVDTEVFWPKKNEGVNLNTYALMERVFEEHGADWNVYLEDDSLLSPDAFSLIEWYIGHEEEIRAVEGAEDIAVYCLLNLRSRGDPETIFLMDAFMGWCFLLDRYQWETYAKPAWCNSKKYWGHEGMWDNSMAKYIRLCGKTICGVFPEVSRVTNTGRIGVHCFPERYDKLMKGHIYNRKRKDFDYKLSKDLRLGPGGGIKNASSDHTGGGGRQEGLDGSEPQGDGPGERRSCGVESGSAGGGVSPEARGTHAPQERSGDCA